MQWENLYYALTQLVHNFGALAVVGGAFAGKKLASETDARVKLAWLVFAGWSAQIFSGLLFGAISLYYYGETPDLHDTAQLAFIIKLVCAASGISLALFYILRSSAWSYERRQRVWHILLALGGTALTAAAFLRWFS